MKKLNDIRKKLSTTVEKYSRRGGNDSSRLNKKGFTLVELIVVLVILAILAALLIPALTGYIDKAKEKSIIAETRSVVIATQTLIDEQYAKKTLTTSLNEGVTIGTETKIDDSGNITLKADDIKNLSEVAGVSASTLTEVKVSTTTGNIGKITQLKYTTDSRTCTYNGTKGTYEVAPAPSGNQGD